MSPTQKLQDLVYLACAALPQLSELSATYRWLLEVWVPEENRTCRNYILLNVHPDGSGRTTTTQTLVCHYTPEEGWQFFLSSLHPPRLILEDDGRIVADVSDLVAIIHQRMNQSVDRSDEEPPV
jgi:hypothetical protein